MMKRRVFAAVAAYVLAGCVLAGCGAAADGNVKNETETVTETAPSAKDEDSKAEEPSAETPEKEPENAEATPQESAESGTEPVFSSAFKEGQVGNNGCYFVKVGDKVYFRSISPDSMSEGTTFGEFLSSELYVQRCPLISYDIKTCEWQEVGTIAGTGELYACPEGFYIGEMNSELFGASCTNLYDPVKNETTYFCGGLPLGVSESGEILAVDQLSGQNMETVLMKDGKEITRLGGENIYFEYVGFAGETLITMLRDANDEYYLYSVDETGMLTELGLIGDAGYGYAVPKQFRFVDGCVYVCLGYYEGSGNFLNRWEIIKAKPGVAGSLEKAINGDDEPRLYEGEGPEPDVPVFYFDTGGALDYAAHVPYQVYMGDGDKGNDLFYYNDIFDECLLVKDFVDRSDYEKCAIIQKMESIGETAFVIYADAVADSEFDIGWRMGYRMTGWHICAIPFDSEHLDEKGLAKDIIVFADERRGADQKPEQAGDPLEGLVAEDILAEFRASNPVKTPDSIEKEATALGSWVQKNTGKLPADTREKGEQIGLHYEFWFGTDVGNNFDSNFPGIYGAYYCLKDYYTSDGKRSTEFYKSAMEQNEFLSNGDPENIKKMYDDMQAFITDCNNIIRSK